MTPSMCSNINKVRSVVVWVRMGPILGLKLVELFRKIKRSVIVGRLWDFKSCAVPSYLALSALLTMSQHAELSATAPAAMSAAKLPVTMAVDSEPSETEAHPMNSFFSKLPWLCHYHSNREITKTRSKQALQILAPTYPWSSNSNTDVNIISIHHFFGCIINHYERKTRYIQPFWPRLMS